MKIGIDAGHGSFTAGKRTPDGFKEHFANVKVAQFFEIECMRCGLETFRTGWDDADYTNDPDTALATRQKNIKANKCDIVISFHFNAYGDGKSYNSANGIETLIHNNNVKARDSYSLAQKVHSYLITGTPQSNRGIKKQSLAMCNCDAMDVKAAILIECGFMTNKYEADLMKSDKFCKECAVETAKGLCVYLGIPYVSEGSKIINSSPTTNITPSDTFLVKLKEDLNIREGAGTVYRAKGTARKGMTYTIVEVKGNWGRLKSGAGWISIADKYVTRV